MWLTSSSIGRKLVMALTGACLVLFLTFHVVMNAVCILWPTAYNEVCMFLGANWYALIASAGLGLLVILHICYAVWLTLQNRKARGADRYAVSTLPPHVEWSSKNMLVLGLVIVVFIGIHLVNFWSKMQLAEILDMPATVDGAILPPEFGTLFIQTTFGEWYWVVLYLIGFAALWLHLNHGIWSMFQTTGWNGRTWLPRLKKIGFWWTTFIVGLFTIEAIVFCIQAKNNYYFENTALQAQYCEYFGEKAHEAIEAINESVDAVQPQLQNMPQDQAAVVIADVAEPQIGAVEAIINGAQKLCPKAFMTDQKLAEAQQFIVGVKDFIGQIRASQGAQAQPQAQPQPQTAPAVEIAPDETVIDAEAVEVVPEANNK